MSPTSLQILFAILLHPFSYTKIIDKHKRYERDIEYQNGHAIVDQQGQRYHQNKQAVAHHPQNRRQQALTESHAHAVHLIAQTATSVFADKQDSSFIIGREQGKDQSLIERQEIAVLITGKNRHQDALKDDDACRQKTKEQGCLTVLPTLQQVVQDWQ